MTVLQEKKVRIFENEKQTIRNISPDQAITMVARSIPGLKNFNETSENYRIIDKAKEKKTGFWLFAEWFLKNDEERYKNLSYIGNENVLLSYTFRKIKNLETLFIMDVQSYQKGGFKECLDKLIKLAISKNIKYIALMAYNDEVRDMYQNKFGFETITGTNYLIKSII